VSNEVDPATSAGPAPLDQVQQSVHSDLQYVSIQVDGKTYGGWYRLLADGQMELLALANMHCERRYENTAVEQARGMLSDFIRVARPRVSRRTLGDLLYADKTKPRVAEQDWVGLIQSIAAHDQPALRELYRRTHQVVFTLITRLVDNRELAEELTLELFRDLREQARHYDAASGSVLGWIMNQARAKALRFESAQPAVVKNAAGSDDSDDFANLPWEQVAPGIACQLFATDSENDRVSMLVRLAPGVEYPAHTHAGVEELHLLQGELWIDERQLHPGDYNRAEPGTADKRVWSETGCTCVLMTSTRDVLA
jgi:anti-sigma factor ChrR (cupin superfamily)